MAYGKIEDWLTEEAALGSPAAMKAFEVRPEIKPHLLFVWEAFSELGSDRPATEFGYGSIPFSAVDRYARRFGIEESNNFSRFLKLVRCLDAAYLKAIKGKS
jgi:hypothetical protein